MSFAWMNGTFLEDAAAAVPLSDTGLLHAAGVFTTMRAYGGKVFRLADHLRRLRRSCEVLFIPLQHKDEVLKDAVAGLLQRNGSSDARLRLTITRGTIQQDPLHGPRLSPTAFLTAVQLEPYPREFYERGMTVIALDEQKLNPYDIQAGHKTLNYLSRLAALRDANQRGAGEALWFNVHNYLESGSISNVFLAKDGKLTTPPTATDLQDKAIAQAVPYPKSAVLPGITRQVAIDLARKHGIDVDIGAINVHQLLEADEVFLTNSIMGVMPVGRIERHAVGNDRAGVLTRQVTEMYQEEVAAEEM